MLTRREFLGAAGVGVGSLLVGCRSEVTVEPPSQEVIDALTLKSRSGAPSITPVVGYSSLGLETPRDGFLYVPPTYDSSSPAPLLILLHGAGGSSDQWRGEALRDLLDTRGMVLLAIDSRYGTWDRPQTGRYDVDVAFLDAALAHVFARCAINLSDITIGGFSDGATEAIGIGAANAGFISRIIAYSPGMLAMPFIRGQPDVFVSHGMQDEVLSFENTRDRIVRDLRRNGMEVVFFPFTGGHEVPDAVEAEAFNWMDN